MTDFLAGLSVETAELPARTSGRGRKVKDNPFTAWVADSYGDKTGRSVPVPVANVKDVQYLIRAAAADLGIGVRIVVVDARGNTVKNEELTKLVENKSTKTVKVMFQGQEKRKYEKKTETVETASE